MNINYKITTIILAVVLVMTYTLHWEGIFSQKREVEEHITTNGMHQMPDGSMMMNTGGSMMDMTMTDMVNMMKGKTGKELEKEFIVGMIPHHQGAVDMAKRLLEDKTISPQMKGFAENIIKAQEGEIKMMNEWLKKY